MRAFGQLLDRLDQQRRAAVAVGRGDPVRAVLGDVDPAVARDRDHRGRGVVRVEVDVHPSQHQHVVAALHGGVPGVGAHDEEADPVVERGRAIGAVQRAEHVGHPGDVAAQLLDADVERGPEQITTSRISARASIASQAALPRPRRRSAGPDGGLARARLRIRDRSTAAARAVEERVGAAVGPDLGRRRATVPTVHESRLRPRRSSCGACLPYRCPFRR